ncbi:MAG: hypothetical protein ABIF40_02115 [archaeon]
MKKIIFIFTVLIILFSTTVMGGSCSKYEYELDGTKINMPELTYDETLPGKIAANTFIPPQNANFYDECLDASTLKEYYCKRDVFLTASIQDLILTEDIDCEYGCVEVELEILGEVVGYCAGEFIDVGTISVIENDCNDRIDNDNDNKIDLGGCDINNNGVLTDNEDYPIAGNSFEEGGSLLSSVLDEQWVRGYCNQNNGNWINADTVCENAFQDADAIWTSTSDWPWCTETPFSKKDCIVSENIITVIETECNDGIDNDNDNSIDLGGCDMNGNLILTDAEDYPIAGNNFEVGGSLSASILDEQWVKGYCNQNNGDWIDADEVCETVFQDANAIWTSTSDWPWDFEAVECANGVDDDGDGKIDYNNGNLGWCDVDNNGKVGERNVYSEIADEYVDETQVTKEECLTDYGDQDGPIASGKIRRAFRNIFGFVTLNINKVSGNAVRLGLVQRNINLTRDSLEIQRPDKAAVWYSWDNDCINSEDDSEAFVQAIAQGLEGNPAGGANVRRMPR